MRAVCFEVWELAVALRAEEPVVVHPNDQAPRTPSGREHARVVDVRGQHGGGTQRVDRGGDRAGRRRIGGPVIRSPTEFAGRRAERAGLDDPPRGDSNREAAPGKGRQHAG